MKPAVMFDLCKHVDSRCRQAIADGADLIESEDEPAFYFLIAAMVLDGVSEALADDIALIRQLPKAQRVVLVSGLIAHHLDSDGYRALRDADQNHLSAIASRVMKQIFSPKKESKL